MPQSPHATAATPVAEGPPVLTLSGVVAALSAKTIRCRDLDSPVAGVVAADLMSDVLVGSRPGQVLVTSLVTPLTIRTASLMDFVAVVFVRGKEPRPEIVEAAGDHDVALLSTTLATFEACGVLYAMVVPAAEGWAPKARLRNTSLVRRYDMNGGTFENAGRVSTSIKDTLKRIGVPADVVRRVSVAAYEAEMNVAMYAHRAVATLRVERSAVELDVDDEGVGIPDIGLALEEGYSTATPEMREMGFGAGMGLPNIRRVSDDFAITSVVREGTSLRMRFLMEGTHV